MEEYFEQSKKNSAALTMAICDVLGELNPTMAEAYVSLNALLLTTIIDMGFSKERFLEDMSQSYDDSLKHHQMTLNS